MLRKLMPLTLGLVLLIAACGSSHAASPTVAHTGQTAAQIVAGLKSKGNPMDQTIDYTADTDPNHQLGQPGQYISKTNFVDSRIASINSNFAYSGSGDIPVVSGGSVEVFANTTDAQTRYSFLESSMGVFAEYAYIDGLAVLRLSPALSTEQAAAYDTAFKALK